MRKLFLVIVILTTAFTGRAQLEVGAFGGGSFYMGDLNPKYPFLQTSLAYGFVARYNLSSRWTAKLNVLNGKLIGDDNKSNFLPERGLRFDADIYEMSIVMEFNFLRYFTGSMKNFISPYIFGGPGFFFAQPKNNGKSLRDYHTEGQGTTFDDNGTRKEYSYFHFSIPFGIGLKYSVSKKIALSVEWGMRKTFTDYIDDVSTSYYLSSSAVKPGDPNYPYLVVSDPGLNHEPYQQRGNSETNDWYSFAGFTITYNIDLTKRNTCSDFERGK
jgi:hypothetical protein